MSHCQVFKPCDVLFYFCKSTHMNFKQYLLSIIFLFLFCCCSTTTKDVQYLQDSDSSYSQIITSNAGIIIEPNDLLSIIVTSKDTELASIFNHQPGLFDKALISELQDIYESERLPKLSVILNGIDTHRTKYKYGYYGKNI